MLTIMLTTTLMLTTTASPAAEPFPIPVYFFSLYEMEGCQMSIDDTMRIALNQRFMFGDEDESSEHSVEEVRGFFSFVVPPYSAVVRGMPAAGGYHMTCDRDTDREKLVLVKLKAPGRTSDRDFRVRWALSSASGDLRYDVHYRVGSGGADRLWKNDTAARSAIFHGKRGKKYFFWVQTMLPSAGATSDPSPTKKVVVEAA